MRGTEVGDAAGQTGDGWEEGNRGGKGGRGEGNGSGGGGGELGLGMGKKRRACVRIR